MKIKIRNAKKSDSSSIIKLIIELANFEKLMPPSKASQKRIIKDAFSRNPPFKILLAETDNKNIIGYAFYFFTYSTFLSRKTLYLEDIYISKNHRHLGIGKKIMKALEKIAKKNKCGRMEWIVLDWNKKAINFYKSFGASELSNWKFFRKEIHKLIE